MLRRIIQGAKRIQKAQNKLEKNRKHRRGKKLTSTTESSGRIIES